MIAAASGKGPILETLLRRLTETPAEFLMPPRHGEQGVIQLDAVVGDLLRLFNPSGDGPSGLGGFSFALEGKKKASVPVEAPRLVLLACWLFADDWFLQRPDLATRVLKLLQTGFIDLAQVVRAADCVTDADRREEFIRRCLSALDLVPAGENARIAQDRLSSLDSVERRRIGRAVAEAERRAREVREALARKAAEEAAANYGRE
ncbi:conserved hypothetical protein [uncultured Gammaproteobacteria bacterium]